MVNNYIIGEHLVNNHKIIKFGIAVEKDAEHSKERASKLKSKLGWLHV